MAISTRSSYNFLYGAAALLLLLYVVFGIAQKASWSGWLLMLFFISLSIAFQSNKLLKGFSFALIIFAAVSLAMYYPQHFQNIGTFKFAALITPLIQLIMFGMGTKMGVQDFAGVVKMPKAVFIGLAGHFTFMPLVGFT